MRYCNDKHINDRLRKLAAEGVEIEKTNNGHLKIRVPGTQAFFLSGTPSDTKQTAHTLERKLRRAVA